MESIANTKNKIFPMVKLSEISECTLEEPYEGKLQVRFCEGCLN